MKELLCGCGGVSDEMDEMDLLLYHLMSPIFFKRLFISITKHHPSLHHDVPSNQVPMMPITRSSLSFLFCRQKHVTPLLDSTPLHPLHSTQTPSRRSAYADFAGTYVRSFEVDARRQKQDSQLIF